jgi:uncharacterized protein (TIGR00369 family)
MEATSTRVRTAVWEDPRELAEAAMATDGLGFLAAMRDGLLPRPPIAALLGFEASEVDAGRIVFRMVPGEHHYNPIGAVHGGVLATLCDSAMGCAVHSMLPAGTGYTTLELKINYVKPVTVETGEVICRAEVVHLGGRTATAEARVEDASGRVLAHATTTCLVMRG